VADVQISKPGGKPNVDYLPGGKVILQYVTMKDMVMGAWKLPSDYVTGGPAWLNSEHYDIVAKAHTTRTDTEDDELKAMLQTLLKERFRLEVHFEKKPMPVYALVAGKKVKLQTSAAGANEKPDCKYQAPQQRNDGQVLRTFACKKVSMQMLAAELRSMAPAYIDRPVVDLTDLKGDFDFTLAWTPRGRNAPVPPRNSDAPTVSEPDGVTVFDALQSQLGLKLEQRKHPMDVLVIDRVERVPTEN